MNRYLSHSSAIINDQQKSFEHSKKRLPQIHVDERERRNTCTLPPPLSSTSTSSKDRRLTLNSINWPIITKNSETVGVHQVNDISTTTNTGTIPPPRDTDSSSTQDSGYSESTPYFLVQQATPDTEQVPTISNTSKVFEKIFFFLCKIFREGKKKCQFKFIIGCFIDQVFFLKHQKTKAFVDPLKIELIYIDYV